jgi:hypothetical protein
MCSLVTRSSVRLLSHTRVLKEIKLIYNKVIKSEDLSINIYCYVYMVMQFYLQDANEPLV